MKQVSQGSVRQALRRSSRMGFFAVVLVSLGAAATPVSAQTANLGAAETFGVLAGSTVANTGTTTVVGDVGVGLNGSITGDAITITEGEIHEGDAVAVQAQRDASDTYDELLARACTSDLTGQNLGGQSLATGVYCFEDNAQLTGSALTLTGTGPWIFRVGGNLTVTAPVTVAGSTQECNGSSVFWLVEDEATIGAGAFVGNILAQADVMLGAGVSLDGRAIALDGTSTVSLNANGISACSGGNLLPVHAPVKVTGGGQIGVPDPDSAGFANYGFNAKPEATGASGHLNYLNHVTGLHVNGTVTEVDVVTINTDGSPRMVRFSGTCGNGTECTFSVTVEDNGEPAVNDRFGIVVVGSEADETTPIRVVRHGNIQVHLGLTTTLNADRFRAGDVMSLDVSMTAGTASPRVDSYLVLRLPTGHLLSLTSRGLVPGLAPLAQNVAPVNFRAVIARLQIPSGTPAGTYTWLSGHTAAGTLNLVSEISERRFTITP